MAELADPLEEPTTTTTTMTTNGQSGDSPIDGEGCSTPSHHSILCAGQTTSTFPKRCFSRIVVGKGEIFDCRSTIFFFLFLSPRFPEMG